MGTFVIVLYLGRFDDPETVKQYQAGWQWVDSPATAQWFHSEAEAHAAPKLPGWSHARVEPYDPVGTLVNPTEIDKTCMAQDALRGMLNERRV